MTARLKIDVPCRRVRSPKKVYPPYGYRYLFMWCTPLPEAYPSGGYGLSKVYPPGGYTFPAPYLLEILIYISIYLVFIITHQEEEGSGEEEMRSFLDGEFEVRAFELLCLALP